jgi:hypothetical protein
LIVSRRRRISPIFDRGYTFFYRRYYIFDRGYYIFDRNYYIFDRMLLYFDRGYYRVRGRTERREGRKGGNK